MKSTGLKKGDLFSITSAWHVYKVFDAKENECYDVLKTFVKNGIFIKEWKRSRTSNCISFYFDGRICYTFLNLFKGEEREIKKLN